MTSMTDPRLTPHHLERKAILYVRQSSPHQVAHNHESRRLQYAMEQRLRSFGWREIEIIDDDLGRSAAPLGARSKRAERWPERPPPGTPTTPSWPRTAGRSPQ